MKVTKGGRVVCSLRHTLPVLSLSLQVLAFVQALFSFTAQSNDLVRVSDEFRRRMTDESQAMAEEYRVRWADMQEEYDAITTVELPEAQVRAGLESQLHFYNGNEDLPSCSIGCF